MSPKYEWPAAIDGPVDLCIAWGITGRGRERTSHPSAIRAGAMWPLRASGIATIATLSDKLVPWRSGQALAQVLPRGVMLAAISMAARRPAEWGFAVIEPRPLAMALPGRPEWALR